MSHSASATAAPRSAPARLAPVETTLLELVQVLSEITEDEQEIAETVASLIDEGRVRLCGNFAGQRLALA